MLTKAHVFLHRLTGDGLAGEEQERFGRARPEMIGRLLVLPDLATGFGIRA